VRSGSRTWATPIAVRDVWFGDLPVEARVYQRDMLHQGDVIPGPAIVQEYGSTVPIPVEFVGCVDRWGNLLLTQKGQS
jgi:N-methylhydantoinase A